MLVRVIQGPKGDMGLQGPQGVAGPAGPKGDSAQQDLQEPQVQQGPLDPQDLKVSKEYRASPELMVQTEQDGSGAPQLHQTAPALTETSTLTQLQEISTQ
jgi:hypothetical protein